MYGLKTPVWSHFLRFLLWCRPLVAAAVVPFLALVIMRLLQWWWAGRMPIIPTEYSAAHLWGDPLLGIMLGLVIHLAQRGYARTMSPAYWRSWIAVACAVAVGYGLAKHNQGVLGSAWYLLKPTTFYHNILLMLLLVPVVGGLTLMVMLAGGWRTWQAIIVVLLGVGYLFLVFYWDPHHPHLEFRSAPGSLDDQFKLWVRHR